MLTNIIKIIGTMLTPYSISWTRNGIIDVILSLKYCSLGFIKKDKKNVLMKEKKDWNSVAGYFLGKLFSKNNTAVILDNEIKIPKNNEYIRLTKILKFCVTTWE